MSRDLVVATERLGWPPTLTRRLAARLRREDPPPTADADRATATCHLQPAEDAPALCGMPWETVLTIPGSPRWTDVHPELRCRECDEAAGDRVERREPTTYLHALSLPGERDTGA